MALVGVRDECAELVLRNVLRTRVQTFDAVQQFQVAFQSLSEALRKRASLSLEPGSKPLGFPAANLDEKGHEDREGNAKWERDREAVVDARLARAKP